MDIFLNEPSRVCQNCKRGCVTSREVICWNCGLPGNRPTTGTSSQNKHKKPKISGSQIPSLSQDRYSKSKPTKYQKGKTPDYDVIPPNQDIFRQIQSSNYHALSLSKNNYNKLKNSNHHASSPSQDNFKEPKTSPRYYALTLSQDERKRPKTLGYHALSPSQDERKRPKTLGYHALSPSQDKFKKPRTPPNYYALSLSQGQYKKSTDSDHHALRLNHSSPDIFKKPKSPPNSYALSLNQDEYKKPQISHYHASSPSQIRVKNPTAPRYYGLSLTPEKYSKLKIPDYYTLSLSQDKDRRCKSTDYYDIRTIMAEYREIFFNVTPRLALKPDDYREALEFGVQVYRVCLDIINDVHALAVDLLSCMCMLDRRSIPRFLFSQGDYKSKDFTSAVRVLIDMSLVTEKEENFFEMHYLVQLGTKRWLESYGNFQRRAEEALALLSNQFPTNGYASLEIYEVLEPHVQALLLNELSTSPHCRLQRAIILHNSGWYATEKGSCVIGQNRAQQAVDIRMELLGKDHEDSLGSLRLLAMAYRYQGRWRKAEELESRVLTPKKSALGGEYPDPEVIMINPTFMYWNQGQSKAVEELGLQVMTPRLKVLREGHTKKVLSMANLLSIYSRQGRWEEAEEVAKQVMKTSTRVLGVEHPDTLTSMIDLIWIYANRQGRRKEAFALGKELIDAGENMIRPEARREMFPVPTPDSLPFRSREWLRRAEKLGVQVMNTSVLAFGEEHPASVTSMINLILIFGNQSKWEELEELELHLINISKRVEDPYALMYLGHLTWTIPLGKAHKKLRMRIQKSIEILLKARDSKPERSVSTSYTGSTLIEANEMKPSIKTVISTTTQVEADTPIPEFPSDSTKDLLETTDGSPRAESTTPMSSRSSSLHIIEFQPEKFRQRPLESPKRKRRTVHFGPGFVSDDVRKGSASSRRSFVDATTFKTGEESMKNLSKSYDTRSVHYYEELASNNGDFYPKVSILSRKFPINATTLEQLEKPSQDLLGLYNTRSDVNSRKHFSLNNGKYPQQRSRAPRLSCNDRCQSKRPGESTKYSSKICYEKRHSSRLQTVSGSDNEDPFRLRSVSSITGATKIKKPIKFNVSPPGVCAPSTHLHSGPDLDFKSDFRHQSLSPTFEMTNMKEQMNHKNYSSKMFVETKESIYASQTLEKKNLAEEVKSTVPNKDEHHSKAKVERATQKISAERHVGLFLAQHGDLKPSYEEALRSMDRGRFIDSIQRLLKQYYFDLSQDAKTEPDRATSNLLQGSLSRLRIAQHIADRFNVGYTEIRAHLRQYVHKTGSKVPDLDAWVAGNADSEPKTKAHESEASNNITSIDEEIFDDDDGSENENRSLLPNAIEMEKILIRGRPFQNFSMNLEVLLLPVTLRSLTRSLMSVPNDHIWFSTEEDLSFSNKMKTFIEDQTEENWNWWPLSPRMRVLQQNQTRLHWRCHCGMHLWTELSIPDAESYQSFLRRRKTVYRHNHLCGTRKHKTSSILLLAGIIQAAGLVFHPGRWYGSSPSSAANSSQATRLNGVAGRSRITNAQLSPQRIPASNQPAAQTSINMPQINESFVLFGVKGTRRTLELAQINARKYISDNAFFWDMRKQYRQLRGFLRYWFSIWRFSHCDFVKFEKIRANRIIPRGKEIPTDMNYEYKPRPPHAEDPPISPHEFELAFSSCASPCVFAAFHDCVEAPNGDFAIERIPKRKSALQLGTGTVEFAWGIQAQYAVSLVNLVVYHFLILAGTFALWAWWQIRHPDDMQNAAVPLTTVTVLLSMFWSSAGLLKIFR